MTVSVLLWFFLTVPWVGLQCETVVFSDHTHIFQLLYMSSISSAAQLLVEYENQPPKEENK